ncbi:MAG: DUF1858 domain-containing protein [Deltaproteobacteria bacterium]|nr:DUF1858 domain-containing protein [Deltaproteobacteria bacterium]
MTEKRPDITPDLKVNTLLEHYPEVEDALISMSPEFERLKNPVLRKTIARIATLRQVARVGGVSLGDLVGGLREAAGITGEITMNEGTDEAGARPDWVRAPVKSFDAREVIEAGEHPLDRVMRELPELGPGEVYELITPFVPAPLLDVARNKGYLTWTAPADSPGEVHNYFAPEPLR